MSDEGFETFPDVQLETAILRISAADSGAVVSDSGLKRIAELWPVIRADGRTALLEIAEHMAVLSFRSDTTTK